LPVAVGFCLFSLVGTTNDSPLPCSSLLRDIFHSKLNSYIEWARTIMRIFGSAITLNFRAE